MYTSGGKQRNRWHFWARGYYCEIVGNVNEETIKKYIEEQYERPDGR